MSGTWTPPGGPTNDPDLFDGSDVVDDVDGLGGDDTLYGNDGQDVLQGGAGNDSIIGGADGDFLIGGEGSDTYFWSPGDGNDNIVGDAEDYVHVNAPSYTIEPGEGGGTTMVSAGGDSFTISGIDTDRIVVVCFVEGTRIMTARGEVPVERLRVGDLAVSPRRAGAMLAPIVWTGHTHVHPSHHPDPHRVAPIRIRAGALADGVPCRDLRVSPDHALFLDGHLVPAKYLVNGSSIAQEAAPGVVAYWHVELPAHGLVLAEGTAAESYFEDGNRHFFDVAGLAPLAMDLAQGGRYDAEACHPVLRLGPALDALRQRIVARLHAPPKPAAA